MASFNQAVPDAFLESYRGRARTREEGNGLGDLVAEASCLYRFVAGRGRDAAAVRAFNPEQARCGYQRAGSVIETNTPDLSFLVDSVTAVLWADGLHVERVRHPILAIERDDDGTVKAVAPAGEDGTGELESCMHFELSERLPAARLEELTLSVRAVLDHLATVVADLDGMSGAIDRLSELVALGGATDGTVEDDAEELQEFLRWIRGGSMILLGFREESVTTDGRHMPVADTALGLLRERSEGGLGSEAELQTGVSGNDRRLLRVMRSAALSPVRRPEPMVTLLVKRTLPDGSVDGCARLLGLLSDRALAEPASRMPQLRHKLQRLLDDAGLVTGSHNASEAIALFNGFPKLELLSAPVDDLRTMIVDLLDLMPGEVRLVGRRARHDRAASLVASLPRAVLTGALRRRWHGTLADAFRSSQVELVEVQGEDRRVLLHAFVRSRRTLPEVDLRQLEQLLRQQARTWGQLIEAALKAHYADPAQARLLSERFSERLPTSYRVRNSAEVAAADIEVLERLIAADGTLAVSLRGERDPAGRRRTRLALIKRGAKIELSAVTPLLEDHGLRVIEERSTRLDEGQEGGSGGTGGGELWIQAFAVLGADGRPLALEAIGDALAASLEAVWDGRTESDSLNRLVLGGALDWRQIRILRAYRSYRQRIGSRFTESFQNDAIVAHPEIVALQIELFAARFDLKRADGTERDRRLAALRARILALIDAVELLDHDRILRNQLGMIEATVRTNVYREDRGAMAFKLRSAAVPAMPGPPPLYEIFVYGAEVEGIHLRGGKIARGGLRWSERMDYRTEVYGLMRAQMTKNAIIVPAGAKGGFVLKRRPPEPQALKQAVHAAYVTYIEALLDLTDNIDSEGRVIQPEGVRVLDDDDSYLVVAADKGTAAFSDVANEVAVRRGFWLGDAFASGGSVGYDHKQLGITARGAWECVKRHFVALGSDPERDPISVCGIGDMSGDVFGNGMLLSKTLRLVAAYDYRDIFIDPQPLDPERCWHERRRLFALPGSSWQDYDRDLLSEGGMIVSRQVKSVTLTEQVKAALAIEADTLDPSELIRAILRAPVDLLWNGGIGTVVKAASESDLDAQDRASDAIRVDGRELRCRVVGEGGNLGFTQRGRIEAALAGVLIDTDFIDNSAGVDISDHEVNLKILLDLAVARGQLTAAERSQLLADVTDDVVEHVLYDSRRQAQLLAKEIAAAPQRGYVYEDLMETLEAHGLLDRAAERLPSGEELVARGAVGLTRPELAVLIAYAKRLLTAELLDSTLPEERWSSEVLRDYFPQPIVARFEALLDQHSLRREIIATRLAGEITDRLGPTFATNISRELGVSTSIVVRCYRLAREIIGARALWEQIERQTDIEQAIGHELTATVDRLVARVARWHMLHRPLGSDEATVAYARGAFEALTAESPRLRTGNWRRQHRERTQRLIDGGAPTALARVHAALPTLYHGPDIIAVAAASSRDVLDVARAFFKVGDVLEIERIEDAVLELATDTRIARWAQQVVIDDLLDGRRLLVERALLDAPEATPDEAVELFLQRRAGRRRRLAGVMRVLVAEGKPSLAGLTLAVRHLRGLIG